jgi:hypothetical protein
MSQLLLSAFADECADSTEAQLRALREHGIGYLEVRHLNKKNISILTREEIEQTKRLLHAFGIGVSAIGSPIGKIGLDADLDAHMQMAERVFSYASRLETPYVRMFSFYASAGKVITDQGDEGYDVYYGWGTVNVASFVKKLKPSLVVKEEGIFRCVTLENSVLLIGIYSSEGKLEKMEYRAFTPGAHEVEYDASEGTVRIFLLQQNTMSPLCSHLTP